ncbi:MAG: type II toxin-antitoxin system VapC family toxin [Ilumatobacteraceae bacterium]
MIVVDASTVVSGLLRAGPVRDRLAHDALHAPHLVDVEVVDALRKLVGRGVIDVEVGDRAVAIWRRLGLTRHPTIGLVPRLWELRANVTAYDAAYVALAEALECPLVTADRRLAGATGPRCAIEVVPR